MVDIGVRTDPGPHSMFVGPWQLGRAGGTGGDWGESSSRGSTLWSPSKLLHDEKTQKGNDVIILRYTEETSGFISDWTGTEDEARSHSSVAPVTMYSRKLCK